MSQTKTGGYFRHDWQSGLNTSGRGVRYFMVCARCGADTRGGSSGLLAPPWYTDLPACWAAPL